MAVTDVNITDWSTTKGDNAPQEGAQIQRDLARQFRLIKSVFRIESLRKHQEQPDELVGTFAYVNASVLSVEGSGLSSLLQEGRIIYAYGPSFVEAIGWIVDVTNPSGNTWLAAINWTLGQWQDDVEEIRIGTAKISPPCVPPRHLRGALSFTNQTVGPTIAVAFRDGKGDTLTLRDTNYLARVVPVGFHTDRSLMIVKSISKSTTGFSFTVGGSEAVPNGPTVRYDWWAFIETWH